MRRWVTAASVVLGVACGGSGGGGPVADAGAGDSATATGTAVVVGLQTDDLGGYAATVRVVATVNGAQVKDEIVSLANLPHEVRLEAPASDLMAKVQVTATALAPPNASAPGPIVIRTAETSFVPGQERLLRLRLEARCLNNLPPGSAPGGPTCDAPNTCISGVCQPDAVDPGALEPYKPTWPDDAPDVCRPADHGPPVVSIGKGQTDYLPLTSGETVQMELGPQGGHHIWIAVRMKNLKQAGSTTTITATQPDNPVMIPPTAFVFTFDTDEGGYCKLFGLRFQLDAGTTDLMNFYKQFLGKPLDVTVTVKDATGATASDTAHVNVDPKLLCPNGTTSCG